MLEKLAKTVSIIFHPLLMPTLGVYLLFHSDSFLSYQPPEIQRAVYIIVFLSTCMLPLSFMPFFLYNQKISSFFVRERKERIIPLAVTVVMYVFAYILILRIPISSVLKGFVLASALNVLMLLVVSFWWKMSAHLVGMGGIVGLFMSLSLLEGVYVIPQLMVSIIVAGIIGSSRLYLDAHNPLQIVAGFLQGIFITVIVLVFPQIV